MIIYTNIYEGTFKHYSNRGLRNYMKCFSQLRFVAIPLQSRCSKPHLICSRITDKELQVSSWFKLWSEKWNITITWFLASGPNWTPVGARCPPTDPKKLESSVLWVNISLTAVLHRNNVDCVSAAEHNISGPPDGPDLDRWGGYFWSQTHFWARKWTYSTIFETHVNN